MSKKKVEVDIYHHKANDSRQAKKTRRQRTRTCANCQGTGRVRNPNSAWNDMTCPTCHGKGWNPVP